jgi:WD40 repeat protein
MRCFEKAWIGSESLQSRRHDSEIDLTNDANVSVFKYKGRDTAISSDGTRLTSITDHNVVTIWQTDGPNQHQVYTTGHHDCVRSVAVSGDGQLVASGSADCTAKLWDPTTGRCLHTFSHPYSVALVIFSPDSTLLASVASDHIRIWDTRTHNLISTIEDASVNTRLAFSPNGNRLVSLTWNYLELWEVATGKPLAYLYVCGCFEKVEFGVDGTSVILEKNNDSLEVVRYGISPTHSSSNDDKDKHSSPQLQFVPLHDTQQSQPVSSHLHCYRLESEWIIDEQKRRVLWVPPDLRYISNSCGKKIALGSSSGRVAMIEVLDVRY